MRKLKVPGRIIGKEYRVPILNGKLLITGNLSPGTIYPINYTETSDALARPTTNDPEFQPYDSDIDRDDRGRDGLPVKREQRPNLRVMLRRIMKNPRHIIARICEPN